MSHSDINKGNPRFAELDGLRALAVVAVILFHCDIAGLCNAGFFGVDLFFMISGFIITAMLAREYRENGDVRFRAFYFRRLKRLLPPVLALIVLAALALAIMSAFNGPASESAFAVLRQDVPAALAYASNMYQIVEKQSYFDTTPHVLKHLWSLAVEEQFYFLWPPLAYLSMKRRGPRATGAVALALALAGTAWMAWLYALNADAQDQNRIYLGTDTHAMGLLAGAALAGFWNPWTPRVFQPSARRLWRAAALLALAGLGWIVHTKNPADPWLYRGGFLIVPLLGAVVAYATMNDARFVVSRLLRRSAVQWLGSRSYSLYLVHWPVFVLARLLGFTDFTRWPVLACALPVTAALAELLYRCVETPCRRFAPRRFGHRQMAASVLTYTAAAWTLFLMTAPWPAQQAPTAAPVVVAAAVQAAAPAAAMPAPVRPPAGAAVPDAAARDAAPGAAASGVMASAGMPPAPAPEPDDAAGADEMVSGGDDIYAIGDSVLLGARLQLQKSIPGMRVDAQVGRQASQGLAAIKAWRSESGKASTIMLHLGTNGYINEGQFRELLQELADRKSVILVNVHADRRWVEPNNELIARMAREFSNVRVLEWHALSEDKPEYFVADGIHLSTRGIRALTAQVKALSGGSVIVPGSAADLRLASARHAGAAHALLPKLGAPKPLVHAAAAHMAADADAAATVSNASAAPREPHAHRETAPQPAVTTPPLPDVP